MSSFVLIPGAGGSPWIWGRVARLLDEAGHETVAVDLPGDDESAGLDRYAELVVEAIGARRDVILVAGSFGGFTAPLVCERVRVGELVLVSAMIPAPGESSRTWWDHTRGRSDQADAARAGGYSPHEDETYFLHDLTPDLVDEAIRFNRPQADIAYDAVCDFASWPDISIRVLVGADDRLFPLTLQRRVARERLGLDVDVIPGGHMLPIVQPRLVADYLLQSAVDHG